MQIPFGKEARATFLNMTPGDYLVMVSKTGYAGSSKQVTVGTENVTTVTVALKAKIAPPVPTTLQPLTVLGYAGGLVALWVGTITVLLLILRANARDHKEKAG